MAPPETPGRRPRDPVTADGVRDDSPATTVSPADGDPAAGHSIAERVLSGADPQLARLAAQGLLPLSADELIPLQVRLAQSTDPQLALESQQSLAAVDARIATAFLERSAGPDELEYFSLELGKPRYVEIVLRRRDTPRELLERLAAVVDSDQQEILLLRQDAVVERPQILEVLAGNPELSSFARRRIAEYREHLLPREQAEREAEEVEPQEIEEASDEEARQAIAALGDSATPPSEVDLEKAGELPEAKIRMLPVQVRLRLARSAPRGLRMIMIRDPNPQVAVQVLRSNAMSDQEIEQIAHSRSVVEEVIEEIARRRSWIRKYPILRAVVANPRTPVGMAVRMVPRLSVRDLRALSKDRNASQAVRDTATRLYRIKRL